MNLEELYQFEQWLETGFAALLAGTCPNIYTSRDTEDMVSPRVEIKAILGPALQHHKSMFSGAVVEHDAFEATLEVTIATNRKGNEGTLNHPRLIGSVRSRLTMRQIIQAWKSPVTLINDIRGTGTIDTFSDENDIDFTSLSYYLFFNVAPTAWPSNLT
jgi:hypothetical protein